MNLFMISRILKIRSTIIKFLRKLNDKIIRDIFYLHEKIVEIFYGKFKSYYFSELSVELLNRINKSYKSLDSTIASQETKNRFLFVHSNFSSEHYDLINKGHEYKIISIDLGLLIVDFINFYSRELKSIIKSPFRVVNVRAWSCLALDRSVKRTTKEWHTDGFHKGHMKLMIYLGPIDVKENGTTELEYYGPIVSNKGCFMLFDNSGIYHRAIKPKKTSERPIIELTIQRVLVKSLFQTPFCGTPSDRHLTNPLFAYIFK